MIKRNYRFIWVLVAMGPFFLLAVGLIFNNDEAFGYDKIRPTGIFSSQGSIPMSLAEERSFHEITTQPFEYLTEGKEFYVFVSKDQKYVVKFFKMRKMTPKYWLNHIPLPWLDARRVRKVDGRERARDEVFKSLQVAFEKFRYQSGLLFLHLFKTDNLHKKIRVRDSSKLDHYIPLDEVPFVLQRKSELLFDYVRAFLEKGCEDEAIHALSQVLELVRDGCKCGFVDEGDRIEEHYGFVDDRAIHVGGRLIQDESLKSSIETLREVFRVSRAIELWLQKNAPHLQERFQAELQDILSFIEEE